MPYAFCNKILKVDLTVGKITVDEPGEAFYRKYLGGTALAMHYLLNEMPAHVDPLGPDNLLVLSIGVLTGAPISGQSRIMANAKSPLTGGIGDAQGGGFWPAELKFAGFDAIVFKGKAPKPVYLWVHDGQAELRDASHLWGKGTGDTEDKIQEELGDKKIRIAGIGPAGENMVKVAAIINFKSRACGRTGMGAVMGSKNLKCVAVRGAQKYQPFNREALTALAREGLEWRKIDLGQQNFTKYGTSGGVTFQQEVGDLPTRNWSSGVFEDWKNLTGENMVETIMIHNDTCYGCAVRCKRVVEVKPGEGKYTVDPAFGGPEYETVATLGSYCGIGDLVAVAKGNELCNDYGLDTIGAGAAIAFAMDCYEHGLLTKADTGGIELKFGNADAMVKLIEMIAKREGFGDVLAEGSDGAARKIGKGAEQYCVTCKGNAFPAHMPQFKRSLGLIYAVNPYGADHQTSEHDHSYSPAYGSEEGLRRMTSLGLNSPRPPMALDEEKVRFALYTQYIYNTLNCAGTCQFVWGGTWQTYGVTPLPRAIAAVTGWDTNVWELMKVGERSLNMMRVFNAREGFDARHDTLPPKVFVPLTGGATDGIAVDREEFEKAKKLYYQMAGWDENGVPTRSKLVELDIPWAADLIGE
jgi:aldehyde:ferredoxin oxidoreductase